MSFDESLRSVVERTPIYFFAIKNGACVYNEDGIKYLAGGIQAAHSDCSHCMKINIREADNNKQYQKNVCNQHCYEHEARSLATRVAYDYQQKHPVLIVSDLTMSDIEDPSVREAKFTNFMLSGTFELPENQVVKPKNSMLNAHIDEE